MIDGPLEAEQELVQRTGSVLADDAQAVQLGFRRETVDDTGASRAVPHRIAAAEWTANQLAAVERHLLRTPHGAIQRRMLRLDARIDDGDLDTAPRPFPDQFPKPVDVE